MAKEIFTAPWYPWYVNDIALSDRVEDMSLAEEGAYRRALDYAWRNGSVPSDPAELARKIKKKCTVQIAQTVLTMFEPMPKDPSRSVNKKLEKVRKEQKNKRDEKSALGKRAALKRWKQKASGDADALPRHSGRNANRTEQNRTDKKEEIREQTASPPARSPEPPTPTLTPPEDPRKNHPAIVAVQDVCRRYPPKEIWDEIIDHVGIDIDLTRMRKCFASWVGRGFNRTNYDWLFDWYVNNRIPTAGNRSNAGNQQNRNGNRPTSTDRLGDYSSVIEQYPSETELGDIA
jgi:uncharacterized protein YdaU (DUF1376 family)